MLSLNYRNLPSKFAFLLLSRLSFKNLHFIFLKVKNIHRKYSVKCIDKMTKIPSPSSSPPQPSFIRNLSTSVLCASLDPNSNFTDSTCSLCTSCTSAVTSSFDGSENRSDGRRQRVGEGETAEEARA